MTSEITAIEHVEHGIIVGADDDLANEAAGYAARSKSAATIRAYQSDWNDFLAFCGEQGRQSLPASPQTVALYITAQARRMKASSIRRRLSSISQAHSLAGHPSPTREVPVRLVWDGIKRTLGTAPEQKAPAIAADIRSMLRCLPSSIKSTNPTARDRLLARDRALLLVGFAGGFRRSELTALTTADCAFNPRGLVVIIRRSKTDQEGAGRSLGIAPQPDPTVCPVRALKAWLKLLDGSEGPIFRGISKHGHIADALSPYAVALVVKRAAAAAGLEADKYSGHSLRSGFATAAHEAGASDRAIMKQTGHRSREMIDRYVRSASMFEDNASALIRI